MAPKKKAATKKAPVVSKSDSETIDVNIPEEGGSETHVPTTKGRKLRANVNSKTIPADEAVIDSEKDSEVAVVKARKGRKQQPAATKQASDEEKGSDNDEVEVVVSKQRKGRKQPPPTKTKPASDEEKGQSDQDIGAAEVEVSKPRKGRKQQPVVKPVNDEEKGHSSDQEIYIEQKQTKGKKTGRKVVPKSVQDSNGISKNAVSEQKDKNIGGPAEDDILEIKQKIEEKNGDSEINDKEKSKSKKKKAKTTVEDDDFVNEDVDTKIVESKTKRKRNANEIEEPAEVENVPKQEKKPTKKAAVNKGGRAKKNEAKTPVPITAEDEDIMEEDSVPAVEEKKGRKRGAPKTMEKTDEEAPGPKKPAVGVKKGKKATAKDTEKVLNVA